MKSLFKIPFRKKPVPIMPEPYFKDNWKSEHFDKNVKNGLEALLKGRIVHIADDGRAYECALEIKRQYILEYQKQLSEKIRVQSSHDEGGMPYVAVFFKDHPYT